MVARKRKKVEKVDEVEEEAEDDWSVTSLSSTPPTSPTTTSSPSSLRRPRRRGHNRADGFLLTEKGAFARHELKDLLVSKMEVAGRVRGDGPSSFSLRSDDPSSFSLLDLCEAATGSKKAASRFVDAELGALPRERNDLRWDVSLSQSWTEAARKRFPAFSRIEERLEEALSLHPACSRYKSVRKEWHAMVVFPGCPDQDLHQDEPSGRRCYLTMIVPLNRAPGSGGTHFQGGGEQEEIVFASLGGYAAFDGKVLHRGLSNRSRTPRVFLYAAAYTGPPDVN